MARPILWPKAPEPRTTVPQAGPFAGLDLHGVAATLGPELSRLAGIRISAEVAQATTPQDQPRIRLCRIRLLMAGAVRFADIDMPAEAVAMLMERMFGASAVQAEESSLQLLLMLPPGSACWSALCRHVAKALGKAFELNGVASGGGPILPQRPAASHVSAGADIGFALDMDGRAAWLGLMLEQVDEPVEAPVARLNPTAWRQLAQMRTLDIELPVALRLSEMRHPLATIGQLRAGDILPIERPDRLELLVDGRRFAALPASDFLAPQTTDDDPFGNSDRSEQ